MKKNYEQPLAELVNFEVMDTLMSGDGVEIPGSMPGLGEGDEDW